MKKEYFCDVYIARIPEGEVAYEALYPESRDKEVSGVRNERVRREKYFVWRLLAHALEASLGLDIKALKIDKNENGKWICGDVNFSLSHGGDAVAVVISSNDVGIDIEPLSAIRNENIVKRILSERELLEFGSLLQDEKEEYVLKKWTAKEAIFKARNDKVFHPQSIEVSDHDVSFAEAVLDGEKYLLSVFSESACEPRLFWGDFE